MGPCRRCWFYHVAIDCPVDDQVRLIRQVLELLQVGFGEDDVSLTGIGDYGCYYEGSLDDLARGLADVLSEQRSEKVT